MTEIGRLSSGMMSDPSLAIWRFEHCTSPVKLGESMLALSARASLVADARPPATPPNRNPSKVEDSIYHTRRKALSKEPRKEMDASRQLQSRGGETVKIKGSAKEPQKEMDVSRRPQSTGGEALSIIYKGLAKEPQFFFANINAERSGDFEKRRVPFDTRGT